jgi:hypothetical protein
MRGGESLVVVDVASGTEEAKAAQYRSCVESSLAVAACLITSEVTTCDGAVAGGRLELRPPMESSDLDEKVLPLQR